MRPSNGPYAASIQAQRRRLEELRTQAVKDAARLESIACDIQALRSEQHEYVEEFVRDTPDALYRIAAHVNQCAGEFVEQLDQLYD